MKKESPIHFGWRKCLKLFICLAIISILVGLFVNQQRIASSRPGLSFTFDPGTNELLNLSRIRYKHTKRQLPHCIIIGSRKGGTRALLAFLDLHPQIRAAMKEIHFFNNDENYNRGINWYRKRMPFSFTDQLTIEKTPAYFVSETAPQRVHHMNSSIKLILIVRNPVERAVSDYLQIFLKRQSKGKEFASFVDIVIDHKTGKVHKSSNPIKRSIYFRHIRRWLVYFPKRQILVLSGERLVKSPELEIKRAEHFLGLDHKVNSEFFYYNETRGFFCIRNETGNRCLPPSKGRKHPIIQEEVHNKLVDFFRPYNKKFYKLVNEDFGW